MAKQLFNSTENSNFILNLTEEKYGKLASVGLIAACLLTSLASAYPVLVGENTFTIAALGLSVAGVICMILALIGGMKKYVNSSVAVPLLGAGVLFVWGIFSLLNSYDKLNVSIYGFPGRGEGLLALAFYLCFFITAASVKKEKTVRTLIYAIIANGLLNSIFAVIQVFTGKFTSYYWVSTSINLNAAEGLSQSPLFLAMVLSISIAASLMGAVLFTCPKQKLLCIVSAAVFSFVIMFTYSFIGICGAVLALVMAIIMIFVNKAPKINLLSVFAVIVPAVISVVIVESGAVGNISSYRLYDGRILWFADSYMRIGSSGTFDDDNVDIDDTYDVYYTLNRKAMDIISGFPLTGTGPDQMVYPQIYTYGPIGTEEDSIEDIVIYNKGTADRVYNEYLNTAATRGIVSAIALAVTLLASVILGINGYKKRKCGYTLCMTLLLIMGMLIFLIGCSNTAFSPIFWSVAGMAIAAVKKDEETAPASGNKKAAPKEKKAEEKPEAPEEKQDEKKAEAPRKEEKPAPKPASKKKSKKKK